MFLGVILIKSFRASGEAILGTLFLLVHGGSCPYVTFLRVLLNQGVIVEKYFSVSKIASPEARKK